jgi:hypothetical protein
MLPQHFSVSQVRLAATCPRILYFDAERARRTGRKPAVTRIWKTGATDQTACGSLFHAAVEKFNTRALSHAGVLELLRTAEGATVVEQGLLKILYSECVNRARLFRAGADRQRAFLTALRRYVGELADILAYGRSQGMAPAEIVEQMFGDRRRRVDVTFETGQGELVHVVGVLDYVFYDWRNGRRRILDYKLTPSGQPTNDLFQVSIYALMHDVQHRTRPDSGVLYLYPERRMVEKSWEQIDAQRQEIYDLLGSMCAWVRFNERSGEGLRPPGAPSYCATCKWRRECARRLGPTEQGDRIRGAVQSCEPRGDVGEGNGVGKRAETRVTNGQQAEACTTNDASDARLQDVEPVLWIGRLTEDEQPVGLPADALCTHVSVVGAAGSGKTWLAKVIAEEAILQGVPVLAVDPQGDLVQMIRAQDPAGWSEEERGRYRRYWDLVEPRVLTPGTSHGLRISLDPMRLAREDDLSRIGDPLRRREELDGILNTTAATIVGLAKAGGETDSQRAFVLQLLRSLVARQGSRLHLENLAAAVADPDSAGLEHADTLIRKPERQRLARKLNALLYGPAANLFAGGQALDLDELCRPRQAGKVPLNIVYLNALADDDQKQFFVASLAAELYRWMITSLEGGRAKLLFYLDEARDYLPAGTRKPPAKEPLMRLFGQGRKYGLACLVCTQSPRSVDYQVFGNASSKIIGRLESQQDVQRVAEWFRAGESAPAWLSGRKGAPAGSFAARWPDMPGQWEGRTFQSRLLFSLHEGAWPPDRLEKELGGLTALQDPDGPSGNR